MTSHQKGSSIECNYCKNKFKNVSSLNYHMKTAIYCLKLRNTTNTLFKCEYCSKNFSSNNKRYMHVKKCQQTFQEIIGLKSNNLNLLKKIEEQNKIIHDIKVEHKQAIRNLQDKLENIALKAIERPFEEETYANINSFDSENDKHHFEDDKIEEYKLSSLAIGEGYNIEHREGDGYINVTNLCKADKKKFSNWKRLEKTCVFLTALSSSIDIHINELVRYKMGSIHEKATWVHPYVAINIAQWISPQFDVKVSSWVYEAMMTGKVDISNTTSYKKIQKENKILKNKYLKRHPRVEYKDKYVIYILTTKLMQNERRYIMGKATNLTNRLSTYNKSDEHRVVYHQGCGDEETMSIVENAVFHHLQKYREQANRERFVLPKNEEITLFSNAIQKSIEYFKK
jgi:hypothetical protein